MVQSQSSWVYRLGLGWWHLVEREEVGRSWPGTGPVVPILCTGDMHQMCHAALVTWQMSPWGT